MSFFMLERKIFMLLFKFLIIFDNSFVNIWMSLFFFLRVQFYFLKFMSIMSNKLKMNFDKMSIFNGFLYCQILFFKFCDCSLLLFNLFMDFVFMNPYKFIKKDFEIILNLFMFLYRYEDMLDNSNFLYLLKNFLDLYYVYGEEVILKFLTNLYLFGQYSLIKNFINLIFKLNQYMNLEVKFVLYKVLNKLDLFMLNKPKDNNKTLVLKKSNKILLFMLNLYFFWFLFYLERIIYIFSKFMFVLWVSNVKRFFLKVSIVFFNFDLMYFDQMSSQLSLFDQNMLNKFFYNKKIYFFTYKFIFWQNHFKRWLMGRSRKKKVVYFFFFKNFKIHSLV